MKSDGKTMVVTETSKVHNDYEFTSNKELLLITHKDRQCEYELIYLYMVIH